MRPPETYPPPNHGSIRRRVIGVLGLGVLGASGAGLLRVIFGGDVATIEVPTVVSSSVQPPPTLDPSLESRSEPSTENTTGHATRGPKAMATGDEVSIPEPLQTTTATVEAENSHLDVVSRDGWGAAPSHAGLIEHTPVRLTLHHTAVEQIDLSVGPARVRQHQTYHQSLGWPDLAYHFVVDRAGVAYEGRAVQFRGDTGTEYDPDGHFLVCMEGNFDVQQPSPEQVETTIQLFSWATTQFGIDPETLAGHNAYAATSCPGQTTEVLLSELADRISAAAPVLVSIVSG